MKLSYFAAFLLTFSSPLVARLHVDVAASSAILINSKTGKVLYEKEAFKPMYPASTTKIAFALYAIKFHEQRFKKRLSASWNAVKSMPESQKSKGDFRQVPSYVLETDSSHMGLKFGEEMHFDELLEASIVVSADDASNVLAEEMGNGSIDKCVEDVNRYIASLGLRSTRFMNPHGMHHPDHVTTAYDLAKLAQEAMKEPYFRKIAKTPRFLRPKTNKQPSVHLQSTNRLLVKGTKAFYAPAIGIKTGYHRRAGHCLVAAAEEKDRSLIAVVLQSPSRDGRFADTTKLFRAAFQEQKTHKTYLAAGPQSLSRDIEGAVSSVSTYTTEPIAYSYYASEGPETRCQLAWHNVSLPLKKGTPVGELLFYADGHLVQKVSLLSADGVDETFFHALERRLTPWTLFGIAGFVAIGLFAIFSLRRSR